MRKSYNTAMMVIVVLTVLFALAVANAAVDAISGIVRDCDKALDPVKCEQMDQP